MIGFSFDGKSSKDFGVYALAIDRTLLPEAVNTSIQIPGRSGDLDTEIDPTYRNRRIVVELGLLGNFTGPEVMAKSREIAFWLSKKGVLIFDDEPDKSYVGRIYDPVDLTPYGDNDYLGEGFDAYTCSVTFNVQPFAFSTELHAEKKDFQQTGNVVVINRGNVKTCGTIIVKNTGSTAINTIRLTRKVVI